MNITQNNGSMSFGKLIIKPHPSKWNQDVLKTALDSEYFRTKIKEDAKQGFDSIMEFSTGSYTLDCGPKFDFQTFAFQSKDRTIRLMASVKRKLLSKFLYSKSKALETQNQQLSKELSEKIYNYSETVPDKARTQISKKIDDIKKIAGDVVFEDNASIELVRENFWKKIFKMNPKKSKVFSENKN